VDTTIASRAAILVMEQGALWPGPMLDWAQHVSVVAQGSRGTAERLVQRTRRAARTFTSSSCSLGCIVISFADAPNPPSASFRANLVQGLGALAPELGCQRLILAAYHVERLPFVELVRLAKGSPLSHNEQIEICFHRAPHLRTRGGSAR
jgi:hypothetical protein